MTTDASTLLSERFSQDEAQSIMGPIASIVADCMAAAWQRWKNMPAEQSFPILPRARAGLIYDYIRYEVRRQFEDGKVSGVRLKEERGYVVLIIENTIIVRFKKLDKYGRARYSRTKRSSDYVNQLELDGLPRRAVRLTAGYQLDPLQTDIKSLLMTYPIGRAVAWAFLINQTEVTGLEITPTFVAPEPPRTRRVIAKKSERDAS